MPAIVRHHPLGAAFALVATTIAAACLSPTQVTVEISTDVDCAAVTANGTLLYSGDPAREAPIAETRACDPSSAPHPVGSLVLAPSGDSDERISVAVVLGVRRRSDECAANAYRGCILAKRRLRFVPHEPLSMPVELSLSCLDVACLPDETCYRGACVSADVEPRGSCLGPDCNSNGPPPDATVADSGVEGDATVAETSADTTSTDAPVADAFVSTNGVRVEPFIANVRAHGLAIANGELYWTVEASDSAFRSPLAAVNPTRLATTPGFYNGIAATSTGYVVGGQRSGAPGACAFVESFDGGTRPIDGAAPGFGVAADPLTTWVTIPSQLSFELSITAGGGRTHSGIAGYYAEFDPLVDLMYTPTAAGIYQWEGASPPILATTAPTTGYGIALGPDHFFVTSTLGDVWVTRRDGGGANVLPVVPPGTFTHAEDVAFDAAIPEWLFVAARRPDGSEAIWKLTGFALP